MDIERLKAIRSTIEAQFNNLSDSKWIDSQREQLRGKYDILGEVIDSLEKEQKNATTTTSTTKSTSSDNSQGK